jgi:hypothetical protein
MMLSAGGAGRRTLGHSRADAGRTARFTFTIRNELPGGSNQPVRLLEDPLREPDAARHCVEQEQRRIDSSHPSRMRITSRR